MLSVQGIEYFSIGNGGEGLFSDAFYGLNCLQHRRMKDCNVKYASNYHFQNVIHRTSSEIPHKNGVHFTGAIMRM